MSSNGENMIFDSTNKIVIPVSPLMIAMAYGKLRVDKNAMSKNYFGVKVYELIQNVDYESKLVAKDGKFTYASGSIPFNGVDIFYSIDNYGKVKDDPVHDTVTIEVRKKIGPNRSDRDESLTKVYHSDAYINNKLKIVKTPVGDYRAIPGIVDMAKAAQNDGVFNLLCKRLGLTIDPSLHQNQVKSIFDRNLERFSSGLK